LLALVPLCAVAQVFRWVDEHGKVHYGDRPIAKDATTVPVLREAKPRDSVPTPGMKAEDVRKAYGEPDRTQNLQTKAGNTVVWTYRKSKLITKDFVLKLEGGEVTEVSTDSWSGGSPAAKAAEAQASARTASEAPPAPDYQAQQAAEKEQRCASLRENTQRIEIQERRGGSAASMDSLREQTRQARDQMWSQRCGS
jgi:hypothetical protein